MSTLLRKVGGSATLLPQVKRSMCVMPNSRTLAVVPDTALATSSGDDITGVAKLFLYTSNDSTRAAYTLDGTLSFASNAPMSATRAFMGSFATDSSGNFYSAYQKNDGALEFQYVPWNTGSDNFTVASAVVQTVVAAGSDGNRYRAIDIAVLSTGNPAIIVYERAANTGQGAYIRVYIRLNDGTTWRKAYETQIMTTQFITGGSEDVSIAWGASGLASNVGRLAIYFTNTSTSGDSGDTLRCISFNVSTGTDLSATVVQTWSSNLNANLAAGSRRGWLFRGRTENAGVDDCWVFGGIVGMTVPFYLGTRLRNGSSSFTVNRTSNAPSDITNSRAGVPQTAISVRSQWALQSATYEDNRLLFMFVGPGFGIQSVILSGLLFRWSDTSLTNDVPVSIDSTSRVLDDTANGAPLAIYGGINRTLNNLGEVQTVNYLVISGDTGSTVSTTLFRRACVGIEHIFAAPVLSQPVSVNVAKDLPNFYVIATGPVPYTNNRGRLRIDISQDPAFLAGVTTITQPASSYLTFQSTDGVKRVTQTMTITPTTNLSSGTWYWRARIQGDLGTLSAYASGTFTISHPPSANVTSPQQAVTIEYDEGDVTFAWTYSDNEPTDSQSAYQIVLTRTDTGATVQDTGKVTSSTNSAVITIAGSLRDIPLAATVTLWDGDNTQGPASSPIYFTVSDPPTALVVYPIGNPTITSGLLTVQWNFVGSPQVQAFYRVVIWNIDASPNTVTADTGWLSGSNSSYTFPTSVITAGVNYKTIVYVKDSAGMIAHSESNLLGNPSFERSASGWTPTSCTVARSNLYANDGTYSLELTPSAACTIESVSDVVTPSHSYNAYGWVYSVAGWANVQLIIDWRNGSDVSLGTPSTVTVAVPAATWTPLQITATAPAGAAMARVKVGMLGSPTSSNKLYVDNLMFKQAPVTFNASWAVPAGATATLSNDKFKVTVAWTNATQDSAFASWRVYRKYNKAATTNLDINNTANTWELIYETTTSSASMQYLDYFAPLNKQVYYMVVQVVDRSGAYVESAIPGSPPSVTIAGDRYYFVPAVPIGTIASFEASSIAGDQFARDIEQAILHVVSRGRQVQIGDDLGYSGTFTLHLRNPNTARSDREFFELLTKSGSGACYVRSPFGDVIYMNLGAPNFNRMAGVGTADLGDLTIPYTQVYQVAPYTRLV